jgi:DNA-directed RNA polymerase specialized sigma24 family protein
MKVNTACLKRKIIDAYFKQQLTLLCWSKIAEKAGLYQDKGFKVTSWLGTVARNCISDHFKSKDRWEKRMLPFLADSGNRGIPDPLDKLPARKAHPQGAGPSTKATNPRATAWDARQGWNTAEVAADRLKGAPCSQS